MCEEYFQRFIDRDNDTILDIAAGYGEFLNNISAKKKIAVDLNEDIKKFVGKDVEVVISDCKKIEQLGNGSVDKIFISNFLEHLNNTDEVITVLDECYRILRKGGKIMILQPNILYVKEKYWFFIDHKTPLTHKSLAEALEVSGFRIVMMKNKFLPYSTKSNLPQSDFVIRIYLKIPLLQFVFGKQTFVIGVK
ncbi:MAG: class I SAM-dependent methyltransferase [Candidatus Moranbacteria bacterium]|nr:class I SAM-dependent methyltransferase [Candidatus Moranbacteria bacterium]